MRAFERVLVCVCVHLVVCMCVSLREIERVVCEKMGETGKDVSAAFFRRRRKKERLNIWLSFIFSLLRLVLGIKIGAGTDGRTELCPKTLRPNPS